MMPARNEEFPPSPEVNKPDAYRPIWIPLRVSSNFRVPRWLRIARGEAQLYPLVAAMNS